MYQETIEQIRLFLGRIVPSIITILLILLSAIPIRLPGLSNVFPNLVLISIFYWGLYRPESLQVLFLFLISFMQDVLLNMPFGVSAIVNLSLHWIIVTQRHFFIGRSFFMIWLTFCGMAVVPVLLLWTLNSFLYKQTVSLSPLLFQYLMTVSVYPFFAWIMIHLHRLIMERE